MYFKTKFLGAVKITPAHDPNDYEVGVRHNLPFINILTDEGIMNDSCGKFAGLKRFDARKQVSEELDKLGLLKETADNPMVVPMCRFVNTFLKLYIYNLFLVVLKTLSNQS